MGVLSNDPINSPPANSMVRERSTINITFGRLTCPVTIHTKLSGSVWNGERDASPTPPSPPLKPEHAIQQSPHLDRSTAAHVS